MHPLRSMAVAAAVLAALVIVLIAACAGVVAQAVAGVSGSSATVAGSVQRTAASWPWGQCTWFVALQRAQMGEPVTWGGDAWQWLANAAAQGYETAPAPLPGEIVVYRRGGEYDPRYGHVALVIAVGAAAYTVAEANYHGLGVIDTRSIAWPDSQVAGFIR